MKLSVISEKGVIKDFLEAASGNRGAEFLISAEWSDLLKSEGENIQLFGVYDNDKLCAAFNLIKVRSLYYYLPRGPVFKSGLSPAEQENIWRFLNSEFKKTGIAFWRVEPTEIPSFDYQQTRNLQPQKTLLLNLALSEEELLANCHPKTRYNIKLAQKKGVKVYEGKTAEDFESFWLLMTETGERDAFKIHNKKHYQTLAAANPEFIKLFLAESAGKVIAAGLFSFYGDKVTYLHGASSHAARQLMAPYLLQWALIRKARAENYKFYDFYGIDAQKWPGVTRFKLGFAGFEVSYAGTLDIVLNKPKYYLYNLLRRLKKLI